MKINGGLTACADDSGDVDVGKAVGELVDVDNAVAGDLLPVRLPLQSVHRVRTSTKQKRKSFQETSYFVTYLQVEIQLENISKQNSVVWFKECFMW